MTTVHFARSGLRQGATMIAAARLLLCTVVLLAPVPLLADEATDAFNQLYGDDVKRVLATPTPTDDIALAKQLIEAAGKAEKQPEFLTILCEKAYELASKDPSGYPTATAAMDLLGDKVPEKKVEGLQKCAALYQKQYTSARLDAKAKAGEAFIERLKAVAGAQAAAQDVDGASTTLRQAITVATAIKSENKAALQAQLESLAPQQKMEKQIATLKAKLDAKPDDDASRKELVRLLLVEEDNAAEAAKFLDDSLDEATRKYVPAAAKPLDEAPELACKELGEWYRGLADQATTPMSKGAMLRRAQGYYERFLDTHKEEDLARTTATLTLKKIEDALAKLPAPKAAQAQWIDLLKKVDVEKNAIRGTWQRQGSDLACTSAENYNRVMVPLPITGSYEVQARVVRVSGNESFMLILPLKSTQFECHWGYTGDKALLSKIGRRGVDAPCRIENGREYEIGIKVLQEEGKTTINATLDGKPLLAWDGPESQVSSSAEWGLPEKTCIGLGAFNCVVTFRSVRLRLLSGDSKTPQPATKLTAAWTDGLKLVDPARDAVKGKWARKGEALATTAEAESSRLAIPVVPAAGYEVQVTFVRATGNDAVTVMLPVGTAACNVTLSAGRGEAHGLEAIHGKWAGDNESSVRPGTLTNGHEYVLAVQVSPEGDGASISAFLDGRALLRWKGPQSALAIPAGWQMPNPRYLGLGAFQSAVEFRRVQIRALPDNARSPAGERIPDERPVPRTRG